MLNRLAAAMAAMGDKAKPFAAYLQSIHEHIHPKFVDGFLGSLASRPDSAPIQGKLVALIEIVIDRQGKLARVSVVQTSGVTEFDVGVLRSIQEAAPGFSQPPEAILSHDGRVYVHWQFYRNPDVACTDKNARPFILKTAPSP